MFKRVGVAANLKLVLLALLVMAVCVSCIYRSVRIRCISPSVEDRPVRMFNRYELNIFGCVDSIADSCGFHIGVDFIETMPATTPFDSIPIFVIDSLCFSGQCQGNDYCLVPRRLYDRVRERIEEGKAIYTPPREPSDIGWSDKEVWPDDFLISRYLLPRSCLDDEVTVQIVARLFDRASGDQLGREEKTVTLTVERSKRYLYR